MSRKYRSLRGPARRPSHKILFDEVAKMIERGAAPEEIEKCIDKNGLDVNGLYSTGTTHNFRDGGRNKYIDRTLLMEAAENGGADVVQMLLRKEADPNVKNVFGSTAFTSANRGKDVKSYFLLEDAAGEPYLNLDIFLVGKIKGILKSNSDKRLEFQVASEFLKETPDANNKSNPHCGTLTEDNKLDVAVNIVKFLFRINPEMEKISEDAKEYCKNDQIKTDIKQAVLESKGSGWFENFVDLTSRDLLSKNGTAFSIEDHELCKTEGSDIREAFKAEALKILDNHNLRDSSQYCRIAIATAVNGIKEDFERDIAEQKRREDATKIRRGVTKAAAKIRSGAAKALVGALGVVSRGVTRVTNRVANGADTDRPLQDEPGEGLAPAHVRANMERASRAEARRLATETGAEANRASVLEPKEEGVSRSGVTAAARIYEDEVDPYARASAPILGAKEFAKPPAAKSSTPIYEDEVDEATQDTESKMAPNGVAQKTEQSVLDGPTDADIAWFNMPDAPPRQLVSAVTQGGVAAKTRQDVTLIR